MIKKVVCLLVAIILFIPVSMVHAISNCSYSEQAALSNEAANIKITYETVEYARDRSTFTCSEASEELCNNATSYKFVISILNMSENFYVEVTNDINEDKHTYTIYDAQDGVITFEHLDTSIIYNYSFTFYSSTNTPCSGEQFARRKLTTPKYNPFSSLIDCVGHEDSDYCAKFVTKDYDLDSFKTKMEALEGKKNKKKPEKKESTIDKFKKYISDNKEIIMIGTGALVIVCGTVIVLKKKQGKKKGGRK